MTTDPTQTIQFPFQAETTQSQPQENPETQEPQEPQTEPLPPALTLSCEEAAALMRISRSMFYKLKNWGLIGPAHFRVGPRLVKYRKDEFEAWVLAGMPKPESWRKQYQKQADRAEGA